MGQLGEVDKPGGASVVAGEVAALGGAGASAQQGGGEGEEAA